MFTRWCAEILQLSPHGFSPPLRNTIPSAPTRESFKGRTRREEEQAWVVQREKWRNAKWEPAKIK